MLVIERPEGARRSDEAKERRSGMDIDELLRYTVERGASDLHLKAGNVPFVRVDGDLSPAELGYLSAGGGAAPRPLAATGPTP